MSQANSWGFGGVVKSVRKDYAFLFERGYEVVSAGGYDMGWQVLLRKQDLFARIVRSRGEEAIDFRTSTQPPDEFTHIGSLIYAATGEKIPPERSSDIEVIQQYLGRIESYFEGEYLKNKDSLRAAEEEYFAAFSQADVAPRTAEEEYYAEFPQARVAVAPEPKRNPILYYPLLVIIILLILGGLVTLCMVLVERLFSFF